MSIPKWINGRYQIIAPLGSGGSSRVYKAIDQKDKNDKIVAIKLLGHLPEREQEVLKEFYSREVRALSVLNHPTIITLLDYGYDEESQYLYITLEYIERAETLRERLPKWKPDLFPLLEVSLEILDGVSYAHQSHIIHRDLNPGNILMDRNGNIKIIDFGISKILGTLSAGQTVAEYFTRPYASPEQISQKDLDYSSDLYSMAALMYFMFSTTEPSSKSALKEQIQKDLERVPTEIKEVMIRMAEEDPNARYPSAHQAIIALTTASKKIEAEKNKIEVQLTKKVINDLYDQTILERNDPISAKNIIINEFSKSVYIKPAEAEGQKGNYYDLLGDSLSLRCVIEPKSLTHFIAIGVSARITPHQLERMRQEAFPINAHWHIGLNGDPISRGIITLSSILDEVDNFIRIKLIQRRRKERRTDLVETWQNILYLDQELKRKTLLQIQYISWHSDEDNTVINVEISNEINVDEFIPPGQLLVMSTKKGKTISVGRYIRQDGKLLKISKLLDCNLDHIGASGKLTVDERQWAASWNRQRLALEAIVNERCINPRLPDILLDPGQAGQSTIIEIEQFFNEDLDLEKKSIVASSLSAKDLFLVQGPPGTGKTVIISEIIAQILSKNPKSHILLVSQSNVAVDNVLMKVGALLPKARIVRIGRAELISQDVESYYVDRRLADWTKTVRDRTQKYLKEHNVISKEESELKEYLGLLQDTLKKISKLQKKGKVNFDDDILLNFQILADKFPESKIETTTSSLTKLAEEISKKIEEQKSPLALCLETWKRRAGVLEDFEDAYLQASSIVAGTCVGIAGKRNLPERFDWVIVDEAGRATPSEILIPLVRAEHGILVGDHKQLPPVIDHELFKEASKTADIDQIWLNKSLFEYLYERLNKDLKTILKIQYRMHPHIANLISSVFYHEEELRSGISINDRQHGWKIWDRAVIWFSTANWQDCYEGDNLGSKYNLEEVGIIVNQLQELEKDLLVRKKQKNVAVITGYQAQMDQLINQIEPRDRKKWKAVNIEINTVDAFQGREEDIVFYSVVRNNRKKQIGFLGDCRRLNVALSRARELLFIVGDHRMVSQAFVKDGINPFRDVIAHINGHPSECRLVE